MSDPLCPKCGVEVEDLDGFGVLFHDECGFCSHPDLYGGVCQACGATVVFECVRCGATLWTWKASASCSVCNGTRQHWGRHRLRITARRFSRLPWPTVTSFFDKANECVDAESYAASLRSLGARVVVVHADHRPLDAAEVDDGA